MTRKKRIWFPGARYHITSRGIRKSSLFYDEEDRYEYLRLLQRTKKKMAFSIQTFCLMTNHIHLQIETLNHPPGSIIRHFHSNYAKYFNQKYNFKGHVFETRYGSELLDSNAYILDANRYIHLNPLRAGIAADLLEYQWSSYGSYLCHDPASFIDSESILSYFPEPRVKNYLTFLYAFVEKKNPDDNVLS